MDTAAVRWPRCAQISLGSSAGARGVSVVAQWHCGEFSRGTLALCLVCDNPAVFVNRPGVRSRRRRCSGQLTATSYQYIALSDTRHAAQQRQVKPRCESGDMVLWWSRNCNNLAVDSERQGRVVVASARS